MLIASGILIVFPEDGHYAVVFFLDISLLIYGIRLLIYYFTMARFMIGGIMTLYKSIIVIDLGLFVFNMTDIPQRLTMIYLIAVMAFDGIIDILNGIESKKLDAGQWKNQFTYGLIKLIIAIISVFFLNSVQMMTYIYCIGLIHSAFSNIYGAFRRTAIVYIE